MTIAYSDDTWEDHLDDISLEVVVGDDADGAPAWRVLLHLPPGQDDHGWLRGFVLASASEISPEVARYEGESARRRILAELHKRKEGKRCR